MVIVVNDGYDEEHLRQTFEMPDDDQLRQAAHSFMTPGVWPTGNTGVIFLAHLPSSLIN